MSEFIFNKTTVNESNVDELMNEATVNEPIGDTKWNMRHESKHHSLERIMEQHKLTKQSLYSKATSDPHIEKIGAYSYLSDVEIYKFKIRVFEASCNLNCVKTIESVQICHEFRTDRYLRA